MKAALNAVLVRLFKIPAEPEPPAGSPGSIRVFRAGRNYYRLQLIRWAGAQAFTAMTILGYFILLHPAAGRHIQSLPGQLIALFELIGAIGFLIQLPVTLLMVRLDFEMRWYMVSDRSLRIRSGIWNINETTLTFANIQQITVQQGPLQRLLGISDLKVTTAGGGGTPATGTGGSSMHCGYFHGIENAPAVKELMQDRLRRLQDAGLGDPDEHPNALFTAGKESDHALEAAQDLLQEAKLLRKLLAETPNPPPTPPAMEAT